MSRHVSFSKGARLHEDVDLLELVGLGVSKMYRVLHLSLVTGQGIAL